MALSQALPSLSDGIQIAIAIATFIAVVVALFREELRSWWHRPELTAGMRLGPPDCHLTVIAFTGPDGGLLRTRPCYYFRIRVENAGRQAAEHVQVFAARLLRRHADGDFREQSEFLPMNLRWSHDRVVYAERLSPQMSRHCDLGHIVHPSENTPLRLALDLEVQPFTGSHLLGQGTYRLELRIAAANVDPVAITMEISFPGDWHDDERTMLSDGIGIRVLPT